MTACLVYQPCSDNIARKNLQTTILNPVPFDEVVDLLDFDLRAQLETACPDGLLYIWGLASPKTRNVWETMQPGDSVIFNTKTVITVSARFLCRTNNRELALRLWGWADAANEITWENIYFVTDVRHHALRYEAIKSVTDIWQNQSFYRYSDTKSAAAFERYPELDHDFAVGDVSLAQAQKDIQDQQTDGTATRPTRLEHRYIVRHLFQGKPTGHCWICHNDYPRHLLVAAHIKKRSACDIKEKLDIENIAASMCRLGCDPLFEHGYISVRNGKVVKHPSREMTSATTLYIESIVDKKVAGWGKKNRKYFDWHLEAHGFEPGELAGVG